MQTKRGLNVRVYRRNRQAIVLLWDRLDGLNTPFNAAEAGVQIGYDDLTSRTKGVLQLSNIVLGVKETDLPRALIQEFRPNGQTVVCIIGHEQNQLDPDTMYYFKVRCYDQEEGERVMPAGVLPLSEKEERKKNVHMYAWDIERNDWNKVCGVRDSKGRFGLLVVSTDQVETGD